MELIVFGVNHHQTPIELREKIALSGSRLTQALELFKGLAPIDESLILSTCNRTEFYLKSEQKEKAIRGVTEFLVDHHKIDHQHIQPHFYCLTQTPAVRHGFRVASSLDSLVVGETQITNQLKQAFQSALELQTTGEFLNHYLGYSLKVAKRVRSETGLSEGLVSVGSVAVDLAQKIFGTLKKAKLCVLGFGEIGQTTAQALGQRGASEIKVLLRNPQKYQDLSLEHFPAVKVGLLSDWLLELAECDIVLTALGGATPFLDRTQVTQLMALRKNRPLLIIDLGLPRNIESSVDSLDNVYLYNIDDLNSMVVKNQSKRASEAKKAEAIIENEVSQFVKDYQLKKSSLKQLSQKLQTIHAQELERTLKKMPSLSDQDRKKLDRMSQAIISRILYDPMLALKEESAQNKEQGLSVFLHKLFRLDEES